ncbi:MAG: reverse transcriptase domain-containing protein [Pseudonocardiaceae bacterium]
MNVDIHTATPPPSHSLMPWVWELRRLRTAARHCMHRSSSPGPDGVTWAQYRVGFGGRLTDLSVRLRTGAWRPGEVRHVPIQTFSGRPFDIAISPVEDRIVHRAMANALQLVLDARVLRDFVAGGRPTRNRLTALRQAARHLADGFSWVTDIDVRSAASGRTVDEVIDWTAQWVTDGSYLRLLRRVLEPLPSAMHPGAALLSQMLHLMLVPIDDTVGHLRVVRFYDNYCVFSRTQTDAHTAYDLLGAALAARQLAPSPAKSGIRDAPNPEDLFLSG